LTQRAEQSLRRSQIRKSGYVGIEVSQKASWKEPKTPQSFAVRADEQKGHGKSKEIYMLCRRASGKYKREK